MLFILLIFQINIRFLPFNIRKFKQARRQRGRQIKAIWLGQNKKIIQDCAPKEILDVVSFCLQR